MRISPAPYCSDGMPAAPMMLPSPTLPNRPQPPTDASLPDAKRWPSASAVTRMVTRNLHRILAPAFLGARGRDGDLVVERGRLLLDRLEKGGEIRAHAVDRLPGNGPDLKDHLAVAARHAGVVRLVVVLLVDRIE